METLIFLIIIGILSVVFGKGKASKGQSRNRRFLPDNIKEIRTLFNQQLDHYSAKKSSPDIVQQKEFDSIEEKYLQTKKELVVSTLELNNQQDTKSLQTIKGADSAGDKQEEETVFSKNVDDNAIINGIIWAEILGEPRSKKPYFTRKG